MSKETPSSTPSQPLKAQAIEINKQQGNSQSSK